MKLTLNLATRPYVNRPLLYAIYAGIGTILLLLAGLNLLNGWRSFEDTRRLRGRIAELEQRSALAVKGSSAYSAEGYVRLNRRIVFANELLEQDNVRWSLLFDRLETLMVDGVRIRGLQPDFKGHTVRLSGVASSVGVLRQFLSRLVAAPDFKRVYLLQQSERKGSDPQGPGVDFTISLTEAAGL